MLKKMKIGKEDTIMKYYSDFILVLSFFNWRNEFQIQIIKITVKML